MASDNEDKLSKTTSSNQTDVSESPFPTTSTPTESVKGDQPTRVASEPICGQSSPKNARTKSNEKISGIFTLKGGCITLNETFPQHQNTKGNPRHQSFALK